MHRILRFRKKISVKEFLLGVGCVAMVVCWGHILLIIMQTEAAILTFEIISFFYSSKNASTKSLKMVGLTV